MGRRSQVRSTLLPTAVSLLLVVGAAGAVMTWPDPGLGVAASATSADSAGLSPPATNDPAGRFQAVQSHRRPRHRPTPTPTLTPTVKPTPKPTPKPTAPPTTPPATPPPPSSGGVAPASVPKVGLPAGTVLHTIAGSVITQAGTVITGADIQGQVVIAADNVVIQRSRVSGQGDLGIYVRSGSLTVTDTTVTGFDNSIGGDNYTATRVEVTKANYDGFKIGNDVTIQDSWCHDLVVVPGAHSDCGQVQSGVVNVMIRRNWFDAGTNANSGLFLAPDLGPSSAGPLVVENNVLGGGNYVLQCVDGADGRYFISNITIRGNHFLRDSWYGPIRFNVLILFSGNVYQDTGLPILL
jgi:hypothetical protein